MVGIIFATLLLTGCDSKGGKDQSGSAPTTQAGQITIAVIPKGLTHEHWKSVEAGAQQAAREAGNVKIVWQGPPKEDDTNQQINLVQSFVSSRVDGIVLAPLSDQALVAPVRMAVKAGIPVVIIDSGLRGKVGEDFVAYVGTDNFNAGKLGGGRMAELLASAASAPSVAPAPSGRRTVLLLRYAESSASTNEREQGFLEALKVLAPDVKVIDPPQYAGADVNSAKKAAENMLTAHAGKFDAIFCPNESSTEGMLLAMQDRQLGGKVKFVGFDRNQRLLDAIKAGVLHGVVVQNPIKMGYLGVKTLLKHRAGEKVDEKIDTGAVLVTADNLNEPEIQKLVHPVFDK